MRHEPWLAPRLSRRCADPARRRGVQDTFLAVWRKPTGWRGEGEVAAWLWGIAIRVAAAPAPPAQPVLERLVPAAAATTASAEEEVLLGSSTATSGGALQRLSPELRAVVQATVLDGLTTREAAALLGIPSGTVKSRMSRARLELREALL